MASDNLRLFPPETCNAQLRLKGNLVRYDLAAVCFILLGIAEQRKKLTVRSSEDCLSLLKIEYFQKVSSAAAVSFRVAQGIGAADDGPERPFLLVRFL